MFEWKLFCTLILLSTWPVSDASAQSGPRTYYVNNSGNDSNPGSKDRPFQTIDKINSLHLRAGDRVLFMSGQTFAGTLKIEDVHGQAAGKVVITSYGTGAATLDGHDSAGAVLDHCSFIQLENLTLTGSGRKTGNTKDGVALVNCDRVGLGKLDISGFQKSGLLIYSSKNVVVNGIMAHDNGAAGITVEGPYQKRESDHIQILNCRAENNPGDPTKLDNHSGNGIVVGSCKNVLIDHCTATNNGWDMPRIGNGPVGIWAYEADSVIIQHCLSYRNKTAKGAADGGGFDFDGGVTHSIIQYCLSYGNEGSGLCIFQYSGASPWHDNIYRYNISENDGTVSDSQAGIYIWNSSSDDKQFYNCEVYGNIIYNSKVAAISFASTSSSKGFRFYHNIFVAKDTLMRGHDESNTVMFEGNDWWSLRDGFNMYGERDFNTWSFDTKLERKGGKLAGLNLKPEFNAPGQTAITYANQLRLFDGYRLPRNSKLYRFLNWPAKPPVLRQ